MKKILIAEDDPIGQRVIKKAVESCGHTAIVASNGQRAFELLQDNHDFALLITDMAMPEKDGRQLVESIRQLDPIKDIPIIIVSGVVGLKEIRDILEIGASRFMPKPINTNDLKGYIQSLLSEG